MEQKWKAGNLRTLWSSEENRVRKEKNYGRGNRWKEIWSSTDKDKSVGHGHFQGNRNLRVKTCIYRNWKVLYLCYPGKIWQSHWDMFSNRQAGVLVMLCVKIWTVLRNLWPNSHSVIVPVMCVCKWSDWNIKLNYAEYPGNILTTIFSHSYRW